MLLPVSRLAAADEPALRAHLNRDPTANLFLLGFLANHALTSSWWYAHGTNGVPITGAVLVLPGRLAVPAAEGDAALQLGRHLATQHAPSLVVGPRLAADQLWHGWTQDRRPFRRFDQRLYVRQRHGDLFEGLVSGFRLATLADAPTVARQAAHMELEDVGIDPRIGNPDLHEAVVRERIRSGRTFVIERQGAVVFQVNVGTSHVRGAQIGGTYVPPAHRGQGLATDGIAAATHHLLRNHPMVTLHVNEANAPAVRVYDKVGYEPHAAFRLLVP